MPSLTCWRSAQRAELERKRINYYTTVGGDDIVRQGVTVDADYWIDTRVWIDWFIKRTFRTTCLPCSSDSPRVPLTDRGVGQIQSVIEDVCEVGRANGGIAPGPVTETTANEIRTGHRRRLLRHPEPRLPRAGRIG